MYKISTTLKMLTYFPFSIQSNFGKNKFETSNVKNIFQGLPWISIHLQTFIFLYAKISLTFIRQQQQLICGPKFQTTALHSIIFYGYMHLRILLGIKHIFLRNSHKKILGPSTDFTFLRSILEDDASETFDEQITILRVNSATFYSIYLPSTAYNIWFALYLKQIFKVHHFWKKKKHVEQISCSDPKHFNGSKFYLEDLVKTLKFVY